MYAFDIVRPTSLDAALEALKGEEAQALAGGQTLIPTLKQRLAAPSQLVSLNAIRELKGIRTEGGLLCIRAATTHAAIVRETESLYPGLSSLASRIGDPAVRTRGTIGGSLANNDPSACYPAAVLASKGTIVTTSREIPADDFFQGLFTTALEEGELITEVRLPVPEVANYQKFIQPASRFALVGVFVAKFPGEVRVAVTGASEEGVFRWADAEEALTARFAQDAVAGLPLPSNPMIGDIHGTPEYRAHLVRVLTGRAVAAAA